jgi:hypothetical protein
MFLSLKKQLRRLSKRICGKHISKFKCYITEKHVYIIFHSLWKQNCMSILYVYIVQVIFQLCAEPLIMTWYRLHFFHYWIEITYCYQKISILINSRIHLTLIKFRYSAIKKFLNTCGCLLDRSIYSSNNLKLAEMRIYLYNGQKKSCRWT